MSDKIKESWVKRTGRKPWIGIFCETNGKTYSSYAEIIADTGLQTKRVAAVTNGLKPHHKGYKFKYVYEEINDSIGRP